MMTTSNILKNVVNKLPFFQFVRGVIENVQNTRYERNFISHWEKNGRPVPPPPAIKRQIILDHAKKYDLQILVETGTYYGDTIQANIGNFKHLYSIELDPALFTKAQEKFQHLNHVHLFHGDSAELLFEIVKSISQPILFWLDGHYSGGDTAKGPADTPIMSELGHILRAPDFQHVILIDDARMFGSDPAYPSKDCVYEFVGSFRSNFSFSVRDDIIRIVL